MGLMGIHRKSSSKHMCFIDQSGRDLLFYLDETRMRVTKYRKTHENRAAAWTRHPWLGYPNT